MINPSVPTLCNKERVLFELPGYSDFRRIGAGGMAEVYSATQVAFKRQVAIKVLMPAYAGDAEYAERFLQEAETVASLAHPHIIPVYDFGQRDGTFYMVMERINGGDLAQWIQRGLEVDETLQIVSQVASALHFVHEKGFVHRDIKPDNIMFRDDNSAVLTDFGVVRARNANSQKTVAGQILGTPKYMSPEQLQGHPLDGRSDLYALGIVLYEMLMKHPPYEDEEFMALAMKHIQMPLPRLPLKYAALQKLFDKMAAKKPESRFQTGLEIVKAVQQMRSGSWTALEDVSPAQAVTSAATTAPLSVSAAMQKLKEKAAVAVTQGPQIREGMSVEEGKPSGLVFKSYPYQANLAALEWTRLANMVSTLNNKLLEWKQDRGGRCGAVAVHVTTLEEHFPNVKSAISKWHNNEANQFLWKQGVQLVLIDAVTGKEQKQLIR